ncbi:MAG TPA: AAA family ATPase [Candidatus Dormibacteraeota bacterium]|nr:AAA family ATPase [Candidatus Dormibacteraeota bacterium]
MGRRPASEDLHLQDPEAEAQVLGACLVDPNQIEPVADLIQDGDWSRESHAQIWAALQAVRGRGEPVDLILVAAELERRGVLEQVGGRSRLAELEEQVPVATVAIWWARRVAALGARRRQIAELLRQLEEARTSPLEPEAQGPPPWVLLSQVEPEVVSWLWRRRLPLGKLTVLDGDPGLGKSCLTMDLAARVTRGREMPDGSPGLGQPAGVVVLAAEDGIADTVLPRLVAAGGDPERVLALTTVGSGEEERDLQLPDDLPHLERAIGEVGARLLIVDPLPAYLAPNLSANNEQDVRRVLRRLGRLAERTGVAVLIVRHLNKAAGLSALHRGSGSMGIVGATRSGLVVGRDPDDPERRVLAATKSNLSADPDALAWRLVSTYDPAGQVEGVPRVEWLGQANRTADELVGALAGGNPAEPRQLREEVKAALLAALQDGPKPANQLLTDLRELTGASERTIRSVKSEIGVLSRVAEGARGPNRWLWRLPDEPNPAQAANVEDGNRCRDDEKGAGGGCIVTLTSMQPCPHCGGDPAPAVPDGWWCPQCLHRWGQQEDVS